MEPSSSSSSSSSTVRRKRARTDTNPSPANQLRRSQRIADQSVLVNTVSNQPEAVQPKVSARNHAKRQSASSGHNRRGQVGPNLPSTSQPSVRSSYESTFCPLENLHPHLYSPVESYNRAHLRVHQPSNDIPSLLQLAVIACGQKFKSLSSRGKRTFNENLPQIAFEALHSHLRCSIDWTTKPRFINDPLFKVQIEQLYFKKVNLTILLRMPWGACLYPYNEGNMFLLDDLNKFERYESKTGLECISMTYEDSEEKRQKLSMLTSLFAQIKNLTIIMEGSWRAGWPFPQTFSDFFQNLFNQLESMQKIVKFTFIRSTVFESVDVRDEDESHGVSLLYRQLENFLEPAKMSKLRDVNIWFSNDYKCDAAFKDTEYPELYLDLSAIMPQLEGFTFVGPCANRESLWSEQLVRATKLTSLTLDVSRTFDRLPPPSTPIDHIRQYFTDRISASLFETVTTLRLYRTDFKDNDNMDVLIRLFPQVHKLQVHQVRRPGVRAFNVDLSAFQYLTELRLHNFDLNGFHKRTEPFHIYDYPSVKKLAFCNPELFNHDLYPQRHPELANRAPIFNYRQFPNVREILFFSKFTWLKTSTRKRADRYLARFHQVYRETLRKCDAIFNAKELPDPETFDKSDEDTGYSFI